MFHHTLKVEWVPLDGRVAQLVEQRILNPSVAGSIPAALTVSHTKAFQNSRHLSAPGGRVSELPVASPPVR